MAEVQSAAVSPEREQSPRPWTQAWTDALPIAPVWVGFALAAGHLLMGAIYFAGIFAPRIGAAWTAYQGALLTTAVYALLIGYATGRAGVRTTRRRSATSNLRWPAMTPSSRHCRVRSCASTWLRFAGSG
jgi:hypothetical protein